jgi:hypothetical protein
MLHAPLHFEPHQPLTAMFGHEAAQGAFTMLRDALQKV